MSNERVFYRILIVEDEILVGMMLKKKIEQQGYFVYDVATSGEAAVSVALEQRPDLLFMDVSLPGELDGVEAARQIKEELEVPVIFFTGNHLDKDLLNRSKEIEPVAILDKMGSFTKVLETIKTTLT